MATTPIIVLAPAGQSGLKLELYPVASDTIANGAGGDTLTESTNRKGRYLANVTEAITGDHYAAIKTSGGNLLSNGWVHGLTDDTTEQYVRDTLEYRVTGSTTLEAVAEETRDSILSRVLSGNYEVAGTVGKILQTIATKTGLIRAGSFTVAGPGFDATNRLEMIRATDYVSDDGFEVDIDLTTDLDITGSTITWTARHKKHPDQIITGTGSVVSASAPKSVNIEATSTEIAKRPGIYGITVFAQPNGTTRKVGIANGDLILEDDWGSETY